ncbi:phage tail protein [Falsiroseomonas sp.]|uniref:phage tail protein n=1 Tax=Falsiroseomonas sp. TaxID=2870721 RepID=UPI00356A19AF
MPVPVPGGQDALTPLPGFAFHVHFAADGGGAFPPFADLDTALTGGFSDVSGLEASMEAKAVKVGGRNHGAIQLPGPVSFATVVLKRGLVESRHLWRWWALFTGADGAPNGDWRAVNRCTVTIAMLRGRTPVLGWKLMRAMPVKFRAGDLSARATDVAIEELHLVHEGLRMEPMA